MDIKISMRLISCFLVYALFGSEAWGTPTQVPNEFSSGSPAKAEEVNENFSALESAIDEHWSRYPDRYYPDWRHEPGFYLTLPKLGNRWKGRLNSEYGYNQTSLRNLNFVNSYDSANAFNRIWLGISVVPNPDGSAGAESRIAAGFNETVKTLYNLSMSHHKDGVYATIEITRAVELDAIYGSDRTTWVKTLSSSSISQILNDLYILLDLANEDSAKSCTTIKLHLNASREKEVSVDGCITVSPV